MGQRKGQMLDMGAATGEGATQRVKYRIPTRGLLVRPPTPQRQPGPLLHVVTASRQLPELSGHPSSKPPFDPLTQPVGPKRRACATPS